MLCVRGGGIHLHILMNILVLFVLFFSLLPEVGQLAACISIGLRFQYTSQFIWIAIFVGDILGWFRG